MIGVEFNEGISAKKVSGEMLSNNVVTGTSGESVLRILPPFIITEKEIAHFTGIFENVLNRF